MSIEGPRGILLIERKQKGVELGRGGPAGRSGPARGQQTWGGVSGDTNETEGVQRQERALAERGQAGVGGAAVVGTEGACLENRAGDLPLVPFLLS